MQREGLEEELLDIMGDKTRCVRVREREVCVQREGPEEERAVGIQNKVCACV